VLFSKGGMEKSQPVFWAEMKGQKIWFLTTVKEERKEEKKKKISLLLLSTKEKIHFFLFF
jgi:hypothetical protein